MKKRINGKRTFLYRTIKCIFGVTVSTAVMISSMPAEVFADPDIFSLPQQIIRTLSTDDEIITEYKINTAQDLISLSAMSPQTYQDAVITITSTNSSLASTDIPDFNGLGSDDYPFRGKIVSSLSTTLHIKTDNALFRCISDKAELPQIIAFTRITDDKKTPLLAQKVVHESGVDSVKNWSVIINKGLDNTNTETNYSFAGMIGEIGDNCKINLSVINNTSASVVSTTHAGMACCVLGKSAELTINYSEPEKTCYNYDVTAENGCAGSLVGYMMNGSKVTMGSSFLYSGTVNAASDITGPEIIYSGYAGGFTGCTENGIFDYGDNNIDMSATLYGSEKSGGFAGCLLYNGSIAESTHIFSLDQISIHTDIRKGKQAGGLFGSLENQSSAGSAFIISGGTNSIGNASSSVKCDAENFGGLIGKYISSSLSSSLDINNLTVTSVRSGGTTTDFGGIIGSIESSDHSGAYIGVLGVNIVSGSDYGIVNYGGIAANASDDGHFINAGNIRVEGKIKGGTCAGGLVGNFESGVLRLSGNTDLSSSVPSAGNDNGQITGKRGQTLIYAAGDGNDSGWTYRRALSPVRTDDVGNWGSVIRLPGVEGSDGVLTYNSSAHTVSVRSAVTAIASQNDLIRTALNIQLNTGNKGALRFDSSSADSTDILSGCLSIDNDISLSGTGITGFTRDYGNGETFRGTLKGNGHTLTLAAGESFGQRNGLAASDEGSGKIYRHTNNGLFAKMSGASVEDLNINGTVNIGADTIIRTGGISACVTGGTNSYRSVTSAQTIIMDGNSVCYTGGKTGEISGGTVDISECTEKIHINYSGTGEDVYLGGTVGYISNAENISVNFSDIDAAPNIISSGAVSSSKAGGLIAGISGGNEKKINISDVKIKGMQIKVKAGTDCGGLIGYCWYDTNVYFKPSGSSDGLIIDKTSGGQDTLLTVDGAAALGGLVYAATGYWQVNDIRLNNAHISAGSGCRYGMLVCYGSDNSGHSLYLEVTSPSAYLINKDSVVLGLDSASVFDEIAAYSTSDSGSGENGQCVISLPAVSGTQRKVLMDGTGCNTYQNQTAKNDGTAWPADPNTRYYYNLDYIRTKNSALLTDGEKLLLWSVSRYGCSNISRYFQCDINNDLSGNFDLKGLSYYPVDIDSNVKIDNSTSVTFYNSQINASEASDSGGSDRIVRGTGSSAGTHSQHYLMHYGLFRNINSTSDSDIDSLTINGTLTLSGSTGMSSAYSGALLCGTVKGSITDMKPNLASVIVSENAGIDLHDLYVKGGNSGYAPLLINRIGSYTNIIIRGVHTTSGSSSYNMDGQNYAASSLIGTVGGDSGTGISISFVENVLDARKKGSTGVDLSSYYSTSYSIFSRATLLDSFRYVEGSGSSGSYDFKWNEDWGNASDLHNVTYGLEISRSVENAGKQEKYSGSTSFVSPVSAIEVSPYDFSGYLPYVYNNNQLSGGSALSFSHELNVNLSHTDISIGCGTYGDPYVISNGAQLEQIATVINGSFPNGFTINYDSDTSILCSPESHSSTHNEYKWNGSDFVSTDENNTTVSKKDMLNYLRDAYYRIDGTITLASTFPGIGTEMVDNTFRGVIVGSNATVIMEGTSPFIKISNGCVVKNINIIYNKEIKLTQDSSARFAPAGASVGAGCSYFGGVIGQLMGGDNIIDNVNVTFNDTVSVSGSYGYLVPVGGYVGVILGGGLIFRNMVSTAGMTEDTCSGISDSKYLYNNPFIGRVLDGYAVYSGIYSAENSTLDNGTKNYVISDITSPDTVSEEQKISVFANTNTLENDVTRKDVSWSKISIPDAQALFVVSLLVSSGASSMEFLKNTQKTDAVSFSTADSQKLYNMHYTMQSPYATGRTHLAEYSSVGNVSDTDDEDFVQSGMDYSPDNISYNSNTPHIQSLDYTSVPYLVYYYTRRGLDYSIASTTRKNITWPSRFISTSYSRYSIEFTAPESSVYDMPAGFRGINALYESSYSANTDRLVIYTFGINANNCTVNMRNSVSEYSSDNYTTKGVGLFPRFIQNMDTSTPGSVKNNALQNGTDSQKEKYAVINLTLSGTVEYKQIDKNGNRTYNGDISVGGFAGITYGKTTGNHYYFENIKLNELSVTGCSNTGGIIGKICNSPSGTETAKNFFVRNITADDLSVSGGTNVGGVIGSASDISNPVYIAGDKNNNSEFKIKTVSAYNSGSVGGLIGVTSKGADIQNMNIAKPELQSENAVVSGYKNVGGIIGYCNNSGANVSVTNCNVHSVNISAVSADGSASGISANTAGAVSVSSCSVYDSVISSGTQTSTVINNSAGMIGYCGGSAAVKDVSSRNNKLSALGSGTKNIGGIAGNLKSTANGYNILSDNNILTCSSKNNKGNLIGSASGNVKFIGVSRQGDTLLSEDIGNGSNTNGYIIYADYNGASCKNGKNTSGAASPYVVINPAHDYNITDKTLTGDGIEFCLNQDNTISSTAGKIMSESSSGSVKSYSKITSKAAEFISGGIYSANLTDYYTAEKESDQKAGINFPVIVIDNNDYSQITKMINDYISLLTNDPAVRYNKIDTSTYQWNNDHFVNINQPSLIYKTATKTLHMANGRYDNEKSRFTLLDVQYADPSGQAGIVYHLYIPVLVKKLLEFEFRADVLSGTDYRASDYENTDKQVVENHGTPVTSLLSFTYKRTYGEWQDAINSGDDLLWNFNKYVLLRWDIGQGQSSRLPAGTKLTLVDKNKENKVYYHTVTQGDFNAGDNSNKRGILYLSSFEGYQPLSLIELLMENTSVDAVSDTAGGLVLNGENGTQQSGATAMACLNGSMVYLRPFDEINDAASVARYRVNVGDQLVSQNIISISEKYYLTVQTAGSQSGVLKNMIEYPENVPLENPDAAGTGLPTYNISPQRSDSDSGMTYVFGNFFTQENLSITTKNQAQIDTGNKCIEALMSVDIRINPDQSISQAYSSYSDNLEVYHAFAISYLEYDSRGIRTGTRNISKYASVNSDFTVSDLSGDSVYEHRSTVNSPEVSKDVYAVKYPVSINGILKQHGNTGIKLSANVIIDYKECTDEVIKNQFPLRNSDSDTDSDSSGIVLRAKSNLSYTDSESRLVNSSITTGNAVEDSKKTHYHVKDVLKATLKYNAGNINTGDSKGNISQLGINANELTGNQTIPIAASGIYDASQLKNADSASKIRFTLTLSKKDDTGSYVRVDIDRFLKNMQFLNNADGSEQTVNLIDSSDGNYYMAETDWRSGKTDNDKFNVITKFEVISKKIFESNDFTYSNYWVNLNAELIDVNGNSIVGSDSSDHIIYTYVRMFTDIIN